MLKIVFYTLLISGSAKSWRRLQFSIFLGAFIFSLTGLSAFNLGNLGSILGVDFVGYVLILLRF